ncbi:MAG: helicase HerA-like domain-containing protein [Saprospiraceae bacterium]
MHNIQPFREHVESAYNFSGNSIIIGVPKYKDQVLTDAFIRLPLKTLNRHGLIAGATGTGKTKTLQIIIEQLSAKGVPSLVMDIKGDLSGVAVPGESNSKIEERHQLIGLPFMADRSPVEFLSLSQDSGLRLRATVSEFGPVLLSKILELNETQSSVISLIFKFCDDNQLPLLDLDDIKKVLNYITNEGKAIIEGEYGAISTASVGTILRKVIELEQQGGDLFFGERSFDIADLVRQDSTGKGFISILRVTDIQDKPKLFSTFMLQLLAEIYSTFPEEGDMSQPKLVIFIDEAHLIFNEASKALLNQIETIVKLIRSKGVGIFFVTQNPTDIPDAVLSQLGLKVQHALRAFTAKDRKAIKLTAENYPLTEFYEVDQLLTELGIGEAIVTALNEKGIPTPLVHVYLRAPQSRMDVLSQNEINSILSRSQIKAKYDEEINRDSAYEILTGKIEEAQSEEVQRKLQDQQESAKKSESGSKRNEKSTFEKVLNSPTTRQIGRTVAQTLTRGLLGVLGLKTTTRKSTRKTSWW